MDNKKIPENDKYLTGLGKFVFFQYFKVYIFLKYSKRVFDGEIGFGQFVVFLKRLLLLYGVIKVNKVVKTRGVYKIHIYLPAFPTRAFFIAIDKFLAKGNDYLSLYPTSVLLSMGKACNHNCPHCYQRLDTTKLVPVGLLCETARQLQDMKISFINIEGGEPMAEYDRLISLLKAINPVRSEVWVNTNGSFATKERAEQMKDAGVFGVMVSLHHWDRDKYDEFAGAKGSYDGAISALRLYRKAGLSTAINCTGIQELVREGGVDKIMKIAKDVGCAYVQLIHEKPAGAWLGKENTLKKEYVKKLCDYHLIYSLDGEYKDYPAISSQAFESQPGNLGCTAGGIERFYINAAGEVQPCEFLNVTFGNIKDEPFLDIYKRMRKVFAYPRVTWFCCTERSKIEAAVARSKDHQTPLSKELSEEIMDSFDLGEKTSLYEKMKLYGK